MSEVEDKLKHCLSIVNEHNDISCSDSEIEKKFQEFHKIFIDVDSYKNFIVEKFVDNPAEFVMEKNQTLFNSLVNAIADAVKK